MYALHVRRDMPPLQAWPTKRGRKPKAKEIHPIAPFDRDLSVSIAMAFDRETLEPVAADHLQTYAQALEAYHLRPESKFHNAEAFHAGTTERRHIVAAEIVHIGKEADKLDERVFLDMDDEAKVVYGSDGSGKDQLQAMLLEAVGEFGCKAVADATHISRGHLTKIIAGGPIRAFVDRTTIVSGILSLRHRGSSSVSALLAKRALSRNIANQW